MAGKKREAYMIEMQKLREGQSRLSEQSAVQGRLTISDIKLPLKSEFMSKIGSAQGKWCCVLVLVVVFVVIVIVVVVVVD